METLEKSKPKVGKYQMLERLQFSKNLQTAIKAYGLLTGEIAEQDIKGMLLDAVCRNNYDEVLIRCDCHNLAAIQARDFSVGKFMFVAPDTCGYISGNSYYLKVRTINGYVEITPTVGDSDCTELKYPNFTKFMYEFKII